MPKQSLAVTASQSAILFVHIFTSTCTQLVLVKATSFSLHFGDVRCCLWFVFKALLMGFEVENMDCKVLVTESML